MHNTKPVFALARTPVVFLGENPPTGEAYGPHTAAVPASRGPGKGGTAVQTDLVEWEGPREQAVGQVGVSQYFERGQVEPDGTAPHDVLVLQGQQRREAEIPVLGGEIGHGQHQHLDEHRGVARTWTGPGPGYHRRRCCSPTYDAIPALHLLGEHA
ncbi:hypothetical protein OG864_51855 [Streptomyces sp. NBC_00124]|uniref:hypothetical protein n=1 Tax=Streptomyces sp. NBC_00124 TaxID=2975662 RepID=UPI00224C84F2|nr:hypothetical protein [Streptomyces sp. NBC_00124]MCX5367176.1 hypothetical protein [Streptomyces sp. NBC_00124]